jgi:serine/threonine protein kinase
MADVSIIKNKYRILHQVGRGGMGNVYEVVHEGLGTTYALKQLHLEFENNPEVASRFRHEAQMMARLQHPNIVRVFDIDSEPGFGTYLLMELIKGVDLGKVLRAHGRLKYSEVLRIGATIASALDTAHRAGLVHRDIKPANILIEETSARAVVTDFGIAKQLEADGEENVTRTGSFIGTYRYCSPEQIRNEKGVKIDGRADIYSLGVVLYEMFSGKKFLDGMSEMQIAHNVAFQSDWRPPLDYPEPPPPEFKLLIEHCLARNREDRPTAAEVCKQLEQFHAVDVERDSCLESKQQFEGLGPDTDSPTATRALAMAETLRSDGQLTQAIAKYREAEASYRQAFTDMEKAAGYRHDIQNLLPALETQVADLQRLQHELVAVKASPTTAQAIAEVARQFQDGQRNADAQDPEASLANLRSLQERVAALHTDAASALRRAHDDALAAVREQWASLIVSAGAFVTPEHTRRFDQLVGAATDAIRSADWPSVRGKVAEAQGLLGQTHTELVKGVTAAVDALLGKVHSVLDDLQARAGDAASETAASVRAIEATIERCLADGKLQEAEIHANEALTLVTAARDRAVRNEQERASLARATLDSLLSGLDLAAARAAAPDAMHALQAARALAAQAEERLDFAAAAEAYGTGARHCRVARERLLHEQSMQLDGVHRNLRTLLERAARAPGAIVGDAVAQAETLFRSPRALDLDEMARALVAGEQARSRLTAALDEAERYARVEEKRAAVEASQQRIAGLEPSPSDLRAAQQLIRGAQAAAARRDWSAAEQQYARVVDALATLEHDLHTRLERQRVDAARARVEALRAGLDLELAARVAAEPLGQARAVEARAGEAEKLHEYAAAVADYEQALTFYQGVARRIAAEQAAQLDAVDHELTALLQRAADAPTEVVGSARAQAQALLEAARPDDVLTAIASRQRARADLAAALDEVTVFCESMQQQAAAAAVQRRVSELGARRWALRTAARLMKQAEAASANRQWVQARECYMRATTAFTALEQTLQARRAPTAGASVDMTQAVTRVTAPSGPIATAASPDTWPLPLRPTLRWVGSAAIGLMAVLVAVWALKLGPFARPLPVPQPPKEHPALEEPTAAAPPPVRQVPAKPLEVEQPAKPPQAERPAVPPPPLAPVIRSFEPATDSVAVREGTRQSFSVALDNPPAEGKLPVEWMLNDKVVATNVSRWEYQPDFKAADGSAHVVQAVVGSGTEKGQLHAWKVNVEDVNRPPVLRKVPPPKLEAALGDSVDLKVTATDDDDDPLTYAWTVDGKKTGGNSPELKVVASADHTVKLTVSDGKDSVSSDWQIAAVKPPPKPAILTLDFTPKEVERVVRFNSPERFALLVPSKQRGTDLKFAWSVDGKKVSDARAFELRQFEPKMVGERAVSVVATATDGQGQSFSHEWKLKVLPPPPQILKASPPAGAVEPDGDRPLTFDLTASPPVGNQKLAYVYKVDANPNATINAGPFTFQPTDDKPHEVSAYVEDNYQQVSRQKIKWSVQTSEIVGKVQQWINEYERAWNAKDANKLGKLRGLDASLVQQLEESLRDKVGLHVKFSDVNIEKMDRSQAKASYHRLDEWTGAMDGKAMSRSRKVQQVFRLGATGLMETEASTGTE